MNKAQSKGSNAADLAADLAADQDWLLVGRITGAHGLEGQVKVFAESDFPERFTVPGDRWLQKPNGEVVPIRLLSGRYMEGKNHYLVRLAGINDRNQAEALQQARLMVPASDRLSLEPGEFHVSDLIGLTVVMQSDQSRVGKVTDVFTTGHDMLEVEIFQQSDDAIAPPAHFSNKTEDLDPDLDPETRAAEPVLPQSEQQVAEALHPSVRAKAAQKLKLQAKRKNKKKKPKTLLIPFVEEIVPVVDVAAGRIEVTPPPGLLDL